MSQGEYVPSVEHNPSASVYTPSAMESASYQQKPAMTKSISYSTTLNRGSTAENSLNQGRGLNAPTSSSAVPIATNYNPGIGESNIEASSFALRQTPTIGDGGRDPETGLFPSPTHSVRNQIGSNKGFTASSYDIRAENSSQNYVSNEGYMSSQKSAQNQIGNSQSFAASSYDIRAENSTENYVSNEGYMSPTKSAARPYTAAQGVSHTT